MSCYNTSKKPFIHIKIGYKNSGKNVQDIYEVIPFWHWYSMHILTNCVTTSHTSYKTKRQRRLATGIQ